MTIQELFIRANTELKKVINQIDDQQWNIEMPAGITMYPAKLGESVKYHALDDAWVPDVLDGKTKQEVGEKYNPILATETANILNIYALYNDRAVDKVRDFIDLDKVVHLSYGDFSAREYLQHITTFRAFRCYDIAKLIGADTTMAEDFVQALWDEFAPLIEGYRQMGIFPAAIEVPDNSNLQTKLLALVGRT